MKNYDHIIATIKSVTKNEDNLIANLSNVCAILKEELNHHWIGFYLVDETKSELVLGPFQGPLACTRIPYRKGVCGSAWESKSILVVKDVHQFEGHIACSSLTNSEIVLPIIKDEKVFAVLDIDSVNFDEFKDEDYQGLSQVVSECLQPLF